MICSELKDGSRDIPEGTRLLHRHIILEANLMQLTYRGIKYNPHSAAAASTHTEHGKYRGKSVDVSVVDQFDTASH